MSGLLLTRLESRLLPGLMGGLLSRSTGLDGLARLCFWLFTEFVHGRSFSGFGDRFFLW
ncbi:hypothetical protein JCM31598_19070 [Desulfonatronum parangueonense]